MNHDRDAVDREDDEVCWSEFQEEVSEMTPGTPFSPIMFEKSRPKNITGDSDASRQDIETFGSSMEMDDNAAARVLLSTIQQPLPPPIPPPQASQAEKDREGYIQSHEDAKILAISRQSQNSNRSRMEPKPSRVPFQPTGDYQSRRSQPTTIETGLDSQSERQDAALDMRCIEGSNRSGPYGRRTYHDDQIIDDDTLGSNRMEYLPSRHFQVSAADKSLVLQSSFYGSARAARDSIRRPSSIDGQQEQQHYVNSMRAELESPSNGSYHSQGSAYTFTSDHSARSYRAGPFRQNSTNSSMLYGEEIDLEADVAMAEAGYRQRQQVYQRADSGYFIGNTDSTSQHNLSNLFGMQIGGGSPFSTGVRYSGGHSMLSSHGFIQLNQEQYHGNGNAAPFTFGVTSEHISNVREHANKLGKGAKKGALTMMEQVTVAAKHIMNKYYRPPLSPRSKELNDLEFLQRRHKEKFEKYRSPNDDSNEEEDDNFFDFVLVLKSEKAYEYWAELLDFRGEYSEDIISPCGGSPTATGSSSGGEDATSAVENKKANFDEIVRSPESDDNENLSTPRTGLLRRRRAKTPSSNSKSPRFSLLRSASQNFDSHHKSQSSRSNTTQFRGTPLMKQASRMSIFEQLIQSPTISGRSRTFSQHSYYSRSNSSNGRNEQGVITETPVRGVERRRWGNPTANLRSHSVKASANTPPVRSVARRCLSEGTQINLDNSFRSSGVKKQPKTKSTKSNLLDDTNKTKEGDEENEAPKSNRGAIPQGFAKTNELTRFLEALRQGIVLRRHRPGEEAAFCRMYSIDGGSTIRYKLINPKDAFAAFEQQRAHYSSGATSEKGPEWSREAETSDESPPQEYREKYLRAVDIASVHPARNADSDYPDERGTASLRQSLSQYDEQLSFSLKVDSKKVSKIWKKRKADEISFKTLDFEAATSGEYWLIFRGLLLLHRDIKRGRLGGNRNAGIGGGVRIGENESERSFDLENQLTRDMFIEPSPVGWVEKLIVKKFKLNDDYIHGAVMPGAIPPVSDYFLGFKSPGTTIWSRLRSAGLETRRIYSVDTRRVMIKIRCPDYRLTDVAEVLRLRMEKKDGSFEPFRESCAGIFKQRQDHLDVPDMYRGRMASLLRSKDRQLIIDFIIGSRIRDSGAQLARTGNIEKIIQVEGTQPKRKLDFANAPLVSCYQFIVDFMTRHRNRDSEDESIVRTCNLGNAIEARIPLHMPHKLDSLCNSWVFYWRKERWIKNSVSKSLSSEGRDSSPTTDEGKGEDQSEDSRPVPNFISRFFVGAFKQPLDSIEDYFGEHVTFYFAWAQHCSVHLLFLAFFGLIVTFCEISAYNLDHPIRPWFSMAVMIWTFTVLVNWRKRSNALAYRWGSLDHKVQETNRPEFQGEFERDPKTNEYRVDPITNEYIIKYPRWKRWLKYMISVPITLFFTGLALFLILMVHANRDTQMANYIEKRINNSTSEVEFTFNVRNIGKKQYVGDVEVNRDLLLDPTYWIIMVTLPSLLGLCIPILNIILMKISYMLNDFENYQTDAQYRTHLIIKVFSFRFVSQFGTVYYYAFMSIDEENSAKAVENGMIRMATSLAIYTTVAHWWNIILQVYIFMGIQHIRRYFYNQGLKKMLSQLERDEEDHIANERCDNDARSIKLENRRILAEQAHDDHWKEIMKAPHDSFPEYITAVVQFTFVACFSVILPCIPFLVLVNYLLSMRFDAYKVCRGRRRSIAKRTGGIGVWEHLLHIVAVIAVLTNCWLVAITNQEFRAIAEEIGSTATVFLVVAWEHAMLLLKYLMGTTISKLPKEIRDEIRAKQHDFEEKIYEDMRLKTEQTRRLKRDKSFVQSCTPDSMSHAGSGFFHHDYKSVNGSSPSSRSKAGTVVSSPHDRSSLLNHFEPDGYSLEHLTTTPEKSARLQTIESFDESVDKLSNADSRSSEVYESPTTENKSCSQSIELFDDTDSGSSVELFESRPIESKNFRQTIGSLDDSSRGTSGDSGESPTTENESRHQPIDDSRPGELYEC